MIDPTQRNGWTRHKNLFECLSSDDTRLRPYAVGQGADLVQYVILKQSKCESPIKKKLLFSSLLHHEEMPLNALAQKDNASFPNI